MRALLGVCGSIAAYKAAEIVRLLQQNFVEVDVAMTASAERFLTPLTFASLTGKTVYTSQWQASGESAFDNPDDFQIEHIAAANRIDALLVAPATASILAKFARGMADDFLSTLYLATRARVLVAPAMNVQMWSHPATQENVRVLIERGVKFIAPEDGYLACGMIGSGRLARVESIVDAVLSSLNRSEELAGQTFLITAGGTREPIDPVRFLGNRSSGKMGHALAEEAAGRGAKVILITASALPAPVGSSVIRVSTAAQMSAAVLDHLAQATVVIKAAAVSDYQVTAVASHKLRRSQPITLALEPTEDIVSQVVARRNQETLVVAFAAETEDLERNARAKLLRKGADAIVANDVSEPEFGFESERNRGLFLTTDKTVMLPASSKRTMAGAILDEIRSLQRSASQRDGMQLSEGV